MRFWNARLTVFRVPVIASEPTVCELLTTYVPVPPVPVPRPVIVVPDAIAEVESESVMPTAMVPDPTALTESVVPEIDPVKVAEALVTWIPSPPEMPVAAEMKLNPIQLAPPVSGSDVLLSTVESQ